MVIRRLVRSLGGRISVSSKIGKGTIAEVVLPATHAVPRNTTPTGSEDLVRA